MTCKNCGKELDAEQKFCDNCGTQVETDSTAEEKDITKEKNTKNTNNKKKWLIGGICIGAAALIAAVIIAFPFIRNSVAKTFMSDAEYLKAIERAMAEEIVDIAAEALDGMDEITADSTKDALSIYDSSKVDVNLSMSLSDSVVNHLSDNAGIDLSFLKNTDLGYNFAVKDDVMGLGLALGLENKQLISANAVMNFNDFITYVTIPELSGSAMKLDLEKLTDTDLSAILESNESNVAFEQALNVYAAFPEGKTVKSIAMRYLDILLSQIETVEKREEAVTVGALSNKYTAFTTVFTPDDLEELNVKILTELKDDEELWSMVEALCDVINPEMADSIRYSRDELRNNYTDMVDSIDGAFDEIGNVTYTAYVNSKGVIMGRRAVTDSGNEFRLMIADSGKNSSFEFEVKDNGIDLARLVVDMTEKNDAVSGTAVIYLEGESAYNITVDEARLDGTAFTMTFTPTEKMAQSLSSISDEIKANANIDLEQMGIDLTKSSVKVEFEADKADSTPENVKYSVELITDSTSAVDIDIDVKRNKIDELTIPLKYKTVDNEAGFVSWLSTADVFGFIGTLPQSISSLITSLLLSGLY